MGADSTGVLFAISFEIVWLLLCIVLVGGIVYISAYLAIQHELISKRDAKPVRQPTLQTYRLYIIISAVFFGIFLWLFTSSVRSVVTRKVNSLLFSHV